MEYREVLIHYDSQGHVKNIINSDHQPFLEQMDVFLETGRIYFFKERERFLVRENFLMFVEGWLTVSFQVDDFLQLRSLPEKTFSPERSIKKNKVY